MESFDYASMRTVAIELLTGFGNTFTLKKLTGKTYDSTTKKQTNTYTEYTGKCVMKNYSAEAVGQLQNIINMGDVEFVCAMDNIAIIPTEGSDQIVYGNKTYNILHIKTSDPSGAAILVHTLHARRVS